MARSSCLGGGGGGCSQKVSQQSVSKNKEEPGKGRAGRTRQREQYGKAISSFPETAVLPSG